MPTGFEVRKIVKKIILHVPLSIGLKGAARKRNIRLLGTGEIESF